MRRKSFIRAGVASSLALFIAGALTCAPVNAAAEISAQGEEPVESDYVFVDPKYELPIIASCSECNGLSHRLNWGNGTDYFYSTSRVGPDVLFGDPDAKIIDATSSDPNIVRTAVVPVSTGPEVEFTAWSEGTAVITVTTDDGRKVEFTASGVDVSDNQLAMEHVKHFAVLTGVRIAHPTDGRTYVLGKPEDASDFYSIMPLWEDMSSGEHDAPMISDGSVVSSDPSVVSVEDGGQVVPHRVGTVTLTITVADLAHPGITATDSIQVHVVEGEDEPSDVVISNDSGASVVFTPSDPAEAEQWDGVTFVNEHLGGTAMDNAWNALITQVKGVKSGGYVFDLHLEKDGKVFAVPDGDSVKVTLPIPEGMGADGIHVFHVADDGTVTDMNAVVDAEAGTITFTTTHFSTFVVAQVASDASGSANSTDAPALPQTGDPSLLIAGMLSLSGVGAIALGARRRQ